MTEDIQQTDNRELDDLFERYRRAPESYAFVPLADACRKMGRLDEAIEICDRGVARHPEYPSGHVVRGKCLFDRGDVAGARRAFERVLSIDSENLVALKYLGLLAAQAGEHDVARRHFQKILLLDPGNRDVRQALRAVEESRQVSAAPREPTPASAAPTVSTERAEHRPAPGTEDAPEIVLGDPIETSDELASITLANIFADQGYKEKAIRIYEELLRKQPDNGLLRARLASLRGGVPGGPAGETGPGESTVVPEDTEQFERIDGEGLEGDHPRGDAEPTAERGQVSSPPTQSEENRTSSSEWDGADSPPEAVAKPIDAEQSLSQFKRWLSKLPE